MTYYVFTESHGDVESGFFASFTRLARLGEFSFSTRSLCQLVKHLAESPEARNATIFGYDISKFLERQGDYTREITQMLMEGRTPESVQSELKKRQAEVPLEDVYDLNNEGLHVPITVDENGHSINIGGYRIPALHFGRFSRYLARGGLFGWDKDDVPDFSEPTLKAIKESRNPLYQEVQKEM